MPISAPRRRLVACGLAAASLIAVVPTAPAGAATSTESLATDLRAASTASYAIDRTDRAAVLAAFRDRFVPLATTPASWSGSTTDCQVGTETPASRQVAVDAVNYYRAMVGLPAVVEEPTWSASSLRSSLMMLAAGELSHAPGTDWPCYSTGGATSAARGNLSLGWRTSPATHVAAYMADADPGNLYAGHRAWIIDPRATRVGSGTTYQADVNGRVRSANTLHVVDDAPDRYTGALPAGTSPWLTWPAAGYTPWLVTPRWPDSTRANPPTSLANWSVGHTTTTDADFSAMGVTATAAGEPLTVTLHPVAPTYGSIRYRTFSLARPGGAAFDPSADLDVSITVSGVTSGGAALAPHSYTVRLIGQAVHGPPTNTKISFGDGATTVSWSAPTPGAVPVDSYRVGLYRDGGWRYATVPATQRSASFAAASPGTWSHAYVSASSPFDTTSGAIVSQQHGGTTTTTTTTTAPTSTTTTTTTASTSTTTTTTTTMPATTTSKAFSDVPTGAHYATAVAWLVDEGITSGCAPSRYCPGDPVTRAQMAAFLWRFGGEQAATRHGFADVAAGTYYDQAVSWLVSTKVTAGCATSRFCPGDQVTRAQMAAFLWRTAGSPPPSSVGTRFSDVPVGAYYAKATEWLAEHGVTNGVGDGRYGPGQPVTRSQMAAFLYRLNTVLAADH